MTQALRLRLNGASLILHNGQTADPINRFSKALKEISSKRKKTDSDHEQMSFIEFKAGLYLSDDGNDLVIPSHMLEAAFVAGAKKTRMGTVAKSAVMIDKDSSLNFDGKPEIINDDSIDELFRKGQHLIRTGVKVSTSKVMRTRPHVRHWSCDVDLTFEEDLMNRSQVIECFQDAGRQVGIGDWRPKHGRFTVAELS